MVPVRSHVFGILLLGFLLVGCQRQEKGQVIAVVGDEALTVEEVLAQMPDEIKTKLTPVDIREFAHRWIDTQVLYEEAKRRDLHEREDLKREFENVKRELLVNKLIEVTLSGDVEVTDEEVAAFYEQNQDHFILEEDLVRAYHVLLPDRDTANQVRRLLRRGQSFEEACHAVLGDTANNQQWDLGYFQRDDIIPEVARTLFEMPRGGISLPIQSDYGYHVVQLVDLKRKGELNPLENVREEIRLKLKTQKKRQRYERFLLQMKNQADITTHFHILDNIKLDSLIGKGD